MHALSKLQEFISKISSGRDKQPSPNVKFHELTSLETTWGNQAIAIYEASFPAKEREPLAELAEQIHNPRQENEWYHFRVMVNGSQQVVGIALFTTIHAQYMSFLRFLAVREDQCNGGLGRYLLTDVLSQVRLDGRQYYGYPHLGIVFEVEQPQATDDPDEQKLRERRINWYKRNGAKLYQDVDLVTPPVSPNHQPIRYHMMFRKAVPKKMVGKTLRRMMVESILVNGYGEAKDSWYVRHALQKQT